LKKVYVFVVNQRYFKNLDTMQIKLLLQMENETITIKMKL